MNFINNVSIATDTKRLMKKVERALCSEDCGVMETLPATESGSRNFIITTEGEPLIEPLGKLASAFSEQGRLILLNHHRCEDSQKVGASLHWKTERSGSRRVPKLPSSIHLLSTSTLLKGSKCLCGRPPTASGKCSTKSAGSG